VRGEMTTLREREGVRARRREREKERGGKRERVRETSLFPGE
jgi:hypothetical protein